MWSDGADGLRVCWDEVRVLDHDDELAVFDDKPNFVQADAMVVIAAYVKKAERLSYLCAAPSV